MTELPRRAVARTARLAALPIGYAGRTAVGMGRRLGGAPAEAVLSEVQQRTAEQLFRTLGDLKGGAMKMGQALSIMEAMLPEEVAAPYREQLTRPQDAAPPMSATTVHAVLAQELGAHWRQQLVEFDDDPAAVEGLASEPPSRRGGRGCEIRVHELCVAQLERYGEDRAQRLADEDDLSAVPQGQARTAVVHGIHARVAAADAALDDHERPVRLRRAERPGCDPFEPQPVCALRDPTRPRGAFSRGSLGNVVASFRRSTRTSGCRRAVPRRPQRLEAGEAERSQVGHLALDLRLDDLLSRAQRLVRGREHHVRQELRVVRLRERRLAERVARIPWRAAVEMRANRLDARDQDPCASAIHARSRRVLTRSRIGCGKRSMIAAASANSEDLRS